MHKHANIIKCNYVIICWFEPWNRPKKVKKRIYHLIRTLAVTRWLVFGMPFMMPSATCCEFITTLTWLQRRRLCHKIVFKKENKTLLKKTFGFITAKLISGNPYNNYLIVKKEITKWFMYGFHEQQLWMVSFYHFLISVRIRDAKIQLFNFYKESMFSK